MRMKFTKGQRRILFFCVLCYTAAYTGRLNLSAALVGLGRPEVFPEGAATGRPQAARKAWAAG